MKPTVGEQAPIFQSNDQNGQPVNLEQYKGKKVVLYFYPKDDTPGCTAEACNFRDNYSVLQAKGYEVIGISTDDEKSHTKFVTKYSIPFTLVADPEQKIVNQYGVWVEKSMYGKKYMGTARTTFLINETGIIEEIIEKVDTKNPTAQILK